MCVCTRLTFTWSEWLPVSLFINRSDYRGQLPLEGGLFSSLYLFNKPVTYSFGVRPASLIALITDQSLALFLCWPRVRTEPNSAVQGSAIT